MQQLVAENRQTFATSVAVKMFLDKHDLEREGATNLCTNIFKNKGDLEKIKEEVELYHLVYTHPNLYVGATHCLAKMACMFCSEPPESVVESMGSVIEKIKSVRGAPTSSINKNDMAAISDELKIHWNGPPINMCSSVVRQVETVLMATGQQKIYTTKTKTENHQQ